MPADRRLQALTLYRRILRAGHNWEGSAEDKRYIFDEARNSFRANREVADQGLINHLLREGQGRLEYATHYGIPYPRLEHANQFHKQYFLRAPAEDPAGPAGPVQGQSKLSAAAERLKRKHGGKQRGADS